MKHCGGCEKTKPHGEFNKNRRQSDGLQTRCRQCEKDCRAANPGKIRAQSSRGQHVFYERCRKARARGVDFTLTLPELLELMPADGRGPVCRVAMERNLGGSAASASSPTIDRIDNRLGYTRENCIRAC